MNTDKIIALCNQLGIESEADGVDLDAIADAVDTKHTELVDEQTENSRMRDEIDTYRRVLKECETRIDTTKDIPVAVRRWMVAQIMDALNQ